LLFIDFRKAFNLVDSDLLINKLFHYGSSNDALNLLKNYVTNRLQSVKINGTLSDKLMSILGELNNSHQVEINWDKTFIMIVTNKGLKIPKSIDFNDINVKVVDRYSVSPLILN
jgi:hypothetical protein